MLFLSLPAPTVDEIAGKIHAPPQWLNQLVYRLHEQKILSRAGEDAAGIVPARPPETITLADVLQAVRVMPDAVELPRAGGAAAALEKLLAELHSAERGTAANRTFRSLATPD